MVLNLLISHLFRGFFFFPQGRTNKNYHKKLNEINPNQPSSAEPSRVPELGYDCRATFALKISTKSQV